MTDAESGGRDRASHDELFPAAVDHPPDTTLLAVGDEERPVWSLRHAVRTRHCVVRTYQRRLAGEIAGENLVLSRSLAAGEGLEGDIVASHRQRSAIPRSVKRDEHTTLVLRRELVAIVDGQR